MRKGSDTDFIVDVPEIGSFTFGRRAMRDEIKIQVEYARMIDGVEPTNWLAAVAGWICALNVLTVRAPADWNIESMDPLANDTYQKLSSVHSALVEKELSFRSGDALRVEENS